MRRLLRKSAQSIILLICAYLGAAVIGPLLPSGAGAQAESGTEIRLISGPIHYDFLLPSTEEVRDRFGFANAAGVPIDSPAVEWIVVGWGASQFYRSAESYSNIPLAAIFRAVTGDHAVMRVDVGGPLPPDAPSLTLTLDDQQFALLLDAITEGLSEFPTGPVHYSDAGFTETDAFFAADGRFNALNTCNEWISDTLALAGIEFGRWTPAPFSIRLAHWWHQAR